MGSDCGFTKEPGIQMENRGMAGNLVSIGGYYRLVSVRIERPPSRFFPWFLFRAA